MDQEWLGSFPVVAGESEEWPDALRESTEQLEQWPEDAEEDFDEEDFSSPADTNQPAAAAVDSNSAAAFSPGVDVQSEGLGGGDCLPVRAPAVGNPKRVRLEAPARSATGLSATLGGSTLATTVPGRGQGSTAQGPTSGSAVGLEFEEAWRLLTDSAVTCDGQRPDFLLAGGQTVDACRGRVFKELCYQSGGKRRRKGTDKWVCKMGRRGCTEARMQGSTDVVRRTYGILTLMDTYGVEIGKATYHQYEIRSPDDSREMHLRHEYRLYHLLGSITPQDASKAASSRETTQCGLLRLQLDSDSDSGKWMQFEDANHSIMGSIEQNRHGFATFNTPAGDFAEWHPRAANEAPLEEGDVVGFISASPNDCRQQITRRTNGASALGVVTHRAAVSGSAPPAHERHLFETIAYTGRVPIKVRGTVTAGSLVGPSGYEDGTAMMLPACCTGPAVGRIEASSDAVHETAENSGLAMELLEHRKSSLATPEEWRSVDCVVVNPAHTMHNSWTARQRCLVALLLLLACAFFAHTYTTTTTAHALVYCPAAEVDMLSWHESTLTCYGCDSSRNTLLHIPRTLVSTQPWRIDCPDSNLIGSVYRTCTTAGWGPLHGSCKRKRCPNTTFHLDAGASHHCIIRKQTMVA
jgi:hypothetical protein